MYEQEKSEISALKKFLLSQISSTPLPPNDLLLSPNSIALKAAVAGLDKELGRLEREERLVQKFTNENTVYAQGGRAPSANDEDVDMDYVKMSKEDAANDNHLVGSITTGKRENADEEDWEEAKATPSPSEKKLSLSDSQDLLHEQIAQKWASDAISRISKEGARVDTPVGALGLALHAAIVGLTSVDKSTKKTEQMFRCTGVPDNAILSQFLGNDKTKSVGAGGGFAPPIRELPKGVLLPSKWEDTAKQTTELVAFRYKCGKDVYTTSSGHTNDSTTLYLVLKVQDSSVKVSFGPMPASSKESAITSNNLLLPLAQHINLDGFQASKSKNNSSAVQPSLFFVALPGLLIQFGSTFGLLSAMHLSFGEGALTLEKEDTTNMEDIPNKMPVNLNEVIDNCRAVPPSFIQPERPEIDSLRVDSHRGMGHRGDFEGDLLPGGIRSGLPGGVPPSFGGSQVGPNHPMFDRTFGGDDDLYNAHDGFGGGFGSPSFGFPGVGGGMRPRFDPYGPPGGPTEPGRGGRGRFGTGRGRGRGRMPPGGSFGPNNDHLQPPNSDYFS